MNRAIRVLAAITLALIVLVVLVNPFDPTPRPGPSNPVQQVLPLLVLFNAYLLGFATGIVMLVAAAQRHHWRWFGPMLPVVVLSAYGPVVGSFLLPVVLATGGAFRPSQTFVILQFASSVGFPALTALASFSYALRARSRIAVPDLDLEVSSIEEPDPVL